MAGTKSDAGGRLRIDAAARPFTGTLPAARTIVERRATPEAAEPEEDDATPA